MPHVDDPGALWMPVPIDNVFQNYWGHKPRYIVIHKTAGGSSAQAIAQMFYNAPDKRSAHYVVGQDGVVVQCVSEQNGAGANCCLEDGHASYLPTDINLNLLTISVEHVDPATDNSTPLTPAQQAASFRLIADICHGTGIPARAGDASGGIIGHNQIAPQSRARCPGTYPMEELFTFLQQGGEEPLTITINTPGISGFFQQQDANHWLCKATNRIIQYGILALYQSYGGTDLCGLTWLGLPMSNEIPLDTDGNTKQFFERGCLIYDQGRKYDNPTGSTGPVYAAHVYGGLGQDPQIAQLQAQITTLQQELATAQNGAELADLENRLAQIKALATA